jgi:hypothetical protein
VGGSGFSWCSGHAVREGGDARATKGTLACMQCRLRCLRLHGTWASQRSCLRQSSLPHMCIACDLVGGPRATDDMDRTRTSMQCIFVLVPPRLPCGLRIPSACCWAAYRTCVHALQMTWWGSRAIGHGQACMQCIFVLVSPSRCGSTGRGLHIPSACGWAVPHMCTCIAFDLVGVTGRTLTGMHAKHLHLGFAFGACGSDVGFAAFAHGCATYRTCPHAPHVIE